MNTVNEIYPNLVNSLIGKDEVIPSRVSQTKELHPVMFEVSGSPFVTSYGRMINLPFALAEIIWIMAGDDSVERLSFYNSKVSQYSDNGIHFNAAYGYRLKYQYGINQFDDVFNKLNHDPDSRQATFIIGNPLTENYNIKTKDRACNIASMFLIRDGKLDLTQIMRSNDIIWGLPHNFIQWMSLQKIMASLLGVQPGTYYHVANSLHIYDYHWNEKVNKFDFDDTYLEKWKIIDMGKYNSMFYPDHYFRDIASAEQMIRKEGLYKTIGNKFFDEILTVLMSYFYWKQKTLQSTELALTVVSNLDSIFYPMLMKNYYQWRLSKDEELLDESDFYGKVNRWMKEHHIDKNKMQEIKNWIKEGK